MRIPIALVAVAALAPVLFLTGCGAANGLPASKAVSVSTPIARPITPPVAQPITTQPAPAQPFITDPRPPAPLSTGLVAVTTWKGVPAAARVYLDAKQIIAYAPDGHVIGDWQLPGDLPVLIAGLTNAFGHSPLAESNGSVGAKYTWDGFVLYDDTPEIVGALDPAYQYDLSVSHVDGVLVETVNHITVGSSGDAAAAIADEDWPPTAGGFYVAEIAPYRLTTPGTGSLWVEVDGGASVHAPITDIRGPVASWLS